MWLRLMKMPMICPPSPDLIWSMMRHSAKGATDPRVTRRPWGWSPYFTSAQQKQEQHHRLCLIILQIKSGEGGHIIGLRNLNWNLRKWNASVTSASHLMQRPTWRWRRWWRWPGWWWAKKRWWLYTDFCFVPCTLRRLANEPGVSYSDVISSNLARS